MRSSQQVIIRSGHNVLPLVSSALYRYSPLAPNEMRFFKLEPGDLDNPLKGSFEVIRIPSSAPKPANCPPLNGSEEYDALSYAWGNGPFSNTVECNEGTSILRISRRVATALQHLRFPDRVRNLWIDAICINQSDNNEKSEQVRNMLRIFQSARQVVVWLGTKSRHSHIAFRASENSLHLLWADSFQGFHENPQDLHKIAQGFIELFDKPWWNRTWVRQEAYAAKTLILQCGDDVVDAKTVHRFPWPQLDEALSRSRHIGFSEYQKKCRNRALALLHLHTSRNAGASFELHELLEGSLEFEVTDPRDRCYAVLGMANIESAAQRYTEDPGHIFPLDYNKSLSEVYQDVVRYYLHSTKTLDILARYQSYNHFSFDSSFATLDLPKSNRHGDLPSWVINWQLQPRKLEHGVRSLTWSAHVKDELRQIVFEKTTSPSQLGLKGYFLGTFRSGGSFHVLKPSQINPICNPGTVLVLDRAYYLLYSLLSEDRGHQRLGTTSSEDGADNSVGGVYTTPNVGDIAVLFYGAKIPFALRPLRNDGDEFEFLGPINMPAARGGDLLQERYRDGPADARSFTIV